MQLSTKGRYAVMAMVDLATRETTNRPNNLSCLADIADRQQLSQSYLEQLFAKLRRGGRRADQGDAVRDRRWRVHARPRAASRDGRLRREMPDARFMGRVGAP